LRGTSDRILMLKSYIRRIQCWAIKLELVLSIDVGLRGDDRQFHLAFDFEFTRLRPALVLYILLDLVNVELASVRLLTAARPFELGVSPANVGRVGLHLDFF